MNLTISYLSRAESSLMITMLVYFLLNGAQIFETAVIVPKWTADPPDSFHIFNGPQGLDFKAFWIITHSIHELTFIASIICCWQISPVRNWLIILFAIHFAVRVWTLTYFAPNIIAFQKMEGTVHNSTELLKRALQWKNLNYIRVALFIMVSLALLPLYYKVAGLKF
jgi:hypothetical protein